MAVTPELKINIRHRDLQNEVCTWSKETFGSSTEQVTDKLLDEFLELVAALDKIEELPVEGDNQKELERDAVWESADVVFMLFQLANNFGYDLLDEVQKKLEVNQARIWVETENGTFQHSPKVG